MLDFTVPIPLLPRGESVWLLLIRTCSTSPKVSQMSYPVLCGQLASLTCQCMHAVKLVGGWQLPTNLTIVKCLQSSIIRNSNFWNIAAMLMKQSITRTETYQIPVCFYSFFLDLWV